MFNIIAALYALKKEVETEAWAAVARLRPDTSFSHPLLPFTEQPRQINRNKLFSYTHRQEERPQVSCSSHSHQIFHSHRSNPSSKQSFSKPTITPPKLRLDCHRHLCLAHLVLSTFVLNGQRDTVKNIVILDHIPPTMTTVIVSAGLTSSSPPA